MTRPPAPVAVIIPAYNAAGWIDETLASVAGQSVPPAEVVVADDCSTDGTVAAAERWVGRLPVRVVSSDANGGPAVARTRAIAASTSPLLALLDADDVWLPDHLATLLELHGRCGGVAMADGLRWHPGRALSLRRWTELEPVPPPARQLRSLYRRNFVFVGTLFSREDFDRAGGFRAQFRGTEDWDLWIRMARSGVPVSAAGHPTVLYRVARGSLSAGERMIDAKVAVLETAAREAPGDPGVGSGLRRARAEAHLLAAYRLSRDDRPWSARARGLAAVRGSARVAVRGLAMLVAPRTTAARREAAREAGFEA